MVGEVDVNRIKVVVNRIFGCSQRLIKVVVNRIEVVVNRQFGSRVARDCLFSMFTTTSLQNCYDNFPANFKLERLNVIDLGTVASK
jgi:hypothetical protein